MNHSRILGIGAANPPIRLTQEQSFHAAGYKRQRIRKIFLNSDIQDPEAGSHIENGPNVHPGDVSLRTENEQFAAHEKAANHLVLNILHVSSLSSKISARNYPSSTSILIKLSSAANYTSAFSLRTSSVRLALLW